VKKSSAQKKGIYPREKELFRGKRRKLKMEELSSGKENLT
jgi:hypothetical protein